MAIDRTTSIKLYMIKRQLSIRNKNKRGNEKWQKRRLTDFLKEIGEATSSYLKNPLGKKCMRA
ncbi:hypothetical protein [Clostridium butyricum]|uniref:hypothetical protein n=1 Tax=Clostridium butyricum TaxID=1492 RepID=UPI0030C85E47